MQKSLLPFVIGESRLSVAKKEVEGNRIVRKWMRIEFPFDLSKKTLV